MRSRVEMFVARSNENCARAGGDGSVVDFVVRTDVEKVCLGLGLHETEYDSVRVCEAYGVLPEMFPCEGVEAKLWIVRIVLQLVKDERERVREIAVLLEEPLGRPLERVGPDERKRHGVNSPAVPP